MLKRISSVIMATAVVTVLAACGQEPPKCSDDGTFSLVRKIILDQLGGGEGLSEKEIKDNMEIEFPRASAYEEKIKKYSCEAKLTVGGMYELPITYESQLDDKGQHIVSVGGIRRGDLIALQAGMIEGIKKSRAEKNSVTKPTEVPPEPKPVEQLASPVPVGKIASGSQCFSEIAITKAISELSSYNNVPSGVDCEKHVYGAGKIICQNDTLKLMDSLDTKAYVYAFENATKSEVNHEKPTLDSAWIASVRNECKDEACLCAAFKAHTNDSLGGLSPYPR